MTAAPLPLIVRRLGLRDYETVWKAMSNYTDCRNADSSDELWLVQHPPVFTQGQAGKEEHLLMPGDIPVVQVDRGGQVTHHAPGQLVAYPLIDLRRRGMGVRDLVTLTENTIIDTLAEFGIQAYAKPTAPGVYVDEAKVASLGFRIRKGCSYHGLSINVDMDLTGFARINPCGYQGLQMVQTKDLSTDPRAASVEAQEQLVAEHFARYLGCPVIMSSENESQVLKRYSPDTEPEVDEAKIQ